REMSDLSPQSGPMWTLIRSLSPIVILSGQMALSSHCCSVIVRSFRSIKRFLNFSIHSPIELTPQLCSLATALALLPLPPATGREAVQDTLCVRTLPQEV